MEIDVLLKPHVGEMRTPIGVEEIEHAQWMVFANGTHVGYLGKKPGSHANIILHMAEGTREKLVKAISAKASEAWGGEYSVDSVMVPPELTPAEEQDEEE